MQVILKFVKVFSTNTAKYSVEFKIYFLFNHSEF